MKPFPLAFLVATIPTLASAGMVTRYHQTAAVGSPQDIGGETDTVSYQEGDKSRADIFRQGEKEAQFSVIVDAAQETFTMLQHHDKVYVTMSPKQVAGIMQGLQSSAKALQSPQVRKQMEAMLAKLPPEQAEKVRAMLAQAQDSKPAPTPLPPKPPKKLATNQKVGKYTCTKYEEHEGNSRTVTCYVPPAELGFTEAEMGFYRKMLSLVDNLVKTSRQSSPGNGFFMGHFDLGIGVESVHFYQDKQVSRGELVSVERKPVDPKLFLIPASYKAGPTVGSAPGLNTPPPGSAAPGNALPARAAGRQSVPSGKRAK